MCSAVDRIRQALSFEFIGILIVTPFFAWAFDHHIGDMGALVVIRFPTLDRPKAEFSGFAQGDGLVAPPDFVSMIGTLLPIAPCARSSLYNSITEHPRDRGARGALPLAPLDGASCSRTRGDREGGLGCVSL